jgi:hypothetical protein
MTNQGTARWHIHQVVYATLSQRYGSGSRPFYYQATIARKTLIPVLRLFYDILFLKNYVNVPSKRNKQKN